MKLNLGQRLGALLQETVIARFEHKPEAEAVLPSELTLIEQAKKDWHNTAIYFDNVTDPELVDHAILLREAAERKYMYLLRQARLAGTRAFTFDEVSIDTDVLASGIDESV